MLNDAPGILPNPTVAPAANASDVIPKDSYSQSYDCDLNGLLSEMKEPREDVNEGKEIIDQQRSSYDQNKPLVKKLSEEEKTLREKRARWEAGFLAKNNDTLQALVCSIIAQEDDINEYRADKDSIKDLEKEIFEMRKDAGEHLPPWVGVVVGLLLMYAPQYKKAVSDRHVNKALVERAARAEAERLAMIEMIRQNNAKTDPPKANLVVEKNEANKDVQERHSEPVDFQETR